MISRLMRYIMALSLLSVAFNIQAAEEGGSRKRRPAAAAAASAATPSSSSSSSSSTAEKKAKKEGISLAKQEKLNEELRQAAMAGEIDDAQTALEEGAEINSIDSDGDSALALACGESQSEMVEFLLRYPYPAGTVLNPNICAQDGRTALMITILEDPDITPIILKYAQNLDINAQDNQGNTALMHAALRENIYVMELLLLYKPFTEYRININAQSNRKKTALMLAIDTGNINAVILFLGFCSPFGEHVNVHSIKDKLGWTAFTKMVESCPTLIEPEVRDAAGIATNDAQRLVQLTHIITTKTMLALPTYNPYKEDLALMRRALDLTFNPEILTAINEKIRSLQCTMLRELEIENLKKTNPNLVITPDMLSIKVEATNLNLPIIFGSPPAYKFFERVINARSDFASFTNCLIDTKAQTLYNLRQEVTDARTKAIKDGLKILNPRTDAARARSLASLHEAHPDIELPGTDLLEAAMLHVVRTACRTKKTIFNALRMQESGKQRLEIKPGTITRWPSGPLPNFAQKAPAAAAAAAAAMPERKESKREDRNDDDDDDYVRPI